MFDQQIIAAARAQMQYAEPIEFLEPEINVRRSITIVYSVDSILSTIAASNLKNFIAAKLPEDVQLCYDISFMEIGDLYIDKVSDGYLWLGMAPDTGSVAQPVMSEFMSAEHKKIDRMYDSDIMSEFCRAMDSVITEDHIPVKCILHTAEPVDPKIANSHYLYGFLTAAFDRLSALIPELKFENLDRVLVKLSQAENDVILFNHSSAKVPVIMSVWISMNTALKNLGKPHNRGAFEKSSEAQLIAYHEHYKQVRDIVNDKVTPSTRVYLGRINDSIVVTQMTNDFWMARRIISMGNRYYHNTRLTVSGLHSETNASKYASASVAESRTTNKY